MSLLRCLLLFAVFLLAPVACRAGSAEEATAAIHRWAAAFNSNSADAVTKLYAPDAILLGTVNPVVTQGSEAIHEYFTRAFDGAAKRGAPAKVEIGETHTMALGDSAAFGTGFYTFAMGPARFTMVLAKRGNEWLIVHHHSSRRPEPPK